MNNSRLLELAIFISCLLILVACFYTVRAQTVDTSANFTHAHNTLLPVVPGTSGQNNPLSSIPPATYDEQLGMTFTQSFVSIAYNVTALAQVDSYGYGPAYLLNGLSNDGYWYQVGISYDWPYSSGGYNQGFYLNYDVFNSAKNVVSPSGGGGGLKSFSGTVNSGDLVLLNLYFNNGIVYMYAKDWNTGAVAYVTYSDSQTTEFIGLSSMSNSNGFFTGLMTEWYHVDQYSGDEYPVTYSDTTFALSSAYMWMDEYQPPNGQDIYFNEAYQTYSSNPVPLQYFTNTVAGSNQFGSAYQFVTGTIGTQMTSITLIANSGSIPLSVNSDHFVVSYTLGGQRQVAYAQDGTLTVFADSSSNVVIAGTSADSSSTEQWVLNGWNDSGTVTAGSTATYYYYDLLSQQVAYWGPSSSSVINPYVTYITAPTFFWGPSTTPSPSTITMLLPYYWQQTIWVQRGTTVTVNSTIAGTAQDQWATPTSSWTITQADQIYDDIFYYHQYQVTPNYATSDNSVPSSAPLLSGTQFGSSYQLLLTTTNQITWLDENTPWSISTIVTAPSGTMQWVATGVTSGSVSGATTVDPLYYHQYQVTASYSTSDSSTPSASVVLSGTSLGSSSSTTLTTTPALVWLDAGSGWSVNNPIVAGSGTERWDAASGTSGTVSSAVTIAPMYYDQFEVTFAVSPSGSGSTSPTGTNVWENTGSLSISATANSEYAFSTWSSNTRSITFSANAESTSTTINGPGTITCNFLAAPTVSASVTTIDQTQTSALTSTAVSTGTGPYTYQWLEKAPGGSFVDVGTNSASYSFVTSGSTIIGSWSFELQVTDAAGEQVTSSAVSVTVSASPTVSIAPVGPLTLDVGQSQTFTATASGGSGTISYQWYLGGSAVSGATSSTYSFSGSAGSYAVTCTVTDSASIPVTSPASNAVTITVNQLTITVTQGANGVIAPGTTNVNYGGSQTFTITPNAGYSTASLTVDGSAVAVASSYTFSNAEASHTITATFALTSTSTPSPTATPTPTAAPTPTPTPSPSPTTSATTVPATTASGTTVDLAISGNITSSQMSNITITTNQSAATTTLSFTLTGESGTTGFGNITIPISAVIYGTTPTVYINGQPAQNQGYTQDSNNYYVWYTTSFSTHQISIVFTTTSPSPSPTPQPSLPLAIIFGVVATVAAVTIVAVAFVFGKSKKGQKLKETPAKK